MPVTWLADLAHTLEALLASRDEIDLSGSSEVTPDPDTIARARRSFG